MKKNDQIKLKVLSNIDDDIISRTAEKRYRLLKRISKQSAPDAEQIKEAKSTEKKQGKLGAIIRTKMTKKAWITTGSIAAGLVLFIGVFLVLLLAKHAPVYKGMSASGDAPVVTLQTEAEYLRSRGILLDTGTTSSTVAGSSGDVAAPESPAVDSADVEKTVKDSLKVQGAEKKIYYVDVFEPIYVTVHIENPDAFEIQSFTLNGKKYSSYMFEKGSDLENLILKIDGVSEGGIYEYTIDAIKYIDGTTIKDVRMDGDQTVRVGAYSYSSQQPHVRVSNTKIGLDSISMHVQLSDSLNLIRDTRGTAKAILYNDHQILGISNLTVNMITEVIFEDLERVSEYTFAVVLAYDDLRGGGFKVKTVYTEELVTKNYLYLSMSNVGFNSADLKLEYEQGYDDGILHSLALYQGSTKLRDLPFDTTTISNLEAGTAYTVKAKMKVGANIEEVSLTFITTKTPYTVKHYWEIEPGDALDLDGDIEVDGIKYRLVRTATHYGTAGEWVTGEVTPYHTVIKPEEQTKILAADGSTTFEYFYRRVRYTVTFDTAGGDPIPSGQYVNGETLPIPTREGYRFLGWYDQGRHTATAISKDVTLVAQWEKIVE